MPTPGELAMAAQLASRNPQNKVSSIKDTGFDPALTYNGMAVPKEVQQKGRIIQFVEKQNKGTNLSVRIVNNHATDTQNFLLFDPCGTAAAAGASANGANIVITSTFAGIGTAAGYAALKESLKGSHLGSLGTTFNFSDEANISGSNIKIWNGNIEDYNSKSLQNYLELARDYYANDVKLLNLSTELYLNNFFAMTGSLPAGESLTILFNVVAISNW